MSLNNYQLNNLIARRKVISSVINQLPKFDKEVFSQGVMSANEFLKEFDFETAKERVVEKYNLVSQKLFKSTTTKRFSYYLGVYVAFGRYCFDGKFYKL